MLVKNLDHLKALATNKNGDLEHFYVLLLNGLAKSSKRIIYLPEEDEFIIIHEIDESYQELPSSKLERDTNLMEAMKVNCLFKSII